MSFQKIWLKDYESRRRLNPTQHKYNPPPPPMSVPGFLDKKRQQTHGIRRLPSYAESTASQTMDAVGHSLWRRTMNAERVPFEALKERSRVCFGGFRPSEACGGATGFSPWGSTLPLEGFS